MTEIVEPKTPLSASRMKTLHSCSWLFYAKYILNVPDRTNDGANKGTVVHAVMEALGDRKKRGGHYNRILKARTIIACPSVLRYVKSYAEKLKVGGEENLADLDKMIVAGLSYDFYGEDFNATESYSEIEFNIKKNEGGKFYSIRGFLDKLFLDKKNGKALIRDFKTSKDIFKGEDLHNNLQHYMYSLAVSHLFPWVKEIETEFLFLRHDLSSRDSYGVQRLSIKDKDIIEGFELELSEHQIVIDNFNLRNACSNMAINAPYPTDKSFGGPIACGYAKVKGQCKKDGTPYWNCSAKFDFKYFLIRDKKSKRVVKTCFEDEIERFSKKYLKKSFHYEERTYAGCPKFLRKNY